VGGGGGGGGGGGVYEVERVRRRGGKDQGEEETETSARGKNQVLRVDRGQKGGFKREGEKIE